jgi:hypothetical protein
MELLPYGGPVTVLIDEDCELLVLREDDETS